MARPARPERSTSARPSRQLSRFDRSINSDMVFGTHRSGSEGIGGLATVEGAIFGLMGLLLAFTISGALQRFDDRRQLVIQEATAATTAHDRLDLFGGDDARRLQSSLKEYIRARADLYRMAHDFVLPRRAEDFSDQQERKVL